MAETKFFERTIRLSPQSQPAGIEFPAKLAFRTFGDVSNPAILLPTCFGGQLEDTLTFLYSNEHGYEPVLPLSKYFIIIVGLLGGGESSSPSNTPAPYHGRNFPRTTYEDNVRFQHALCLSLGVKKLFACIGFSMGGQQAYHMSALFPDFIQKMVCLAGSAKTSWHNWCVLDGLKHTLMNSPDFHDGLYTEQAIKGLQVFDRVYTSWALSQAWFRQNCWEQLGFKTLEKYLDESCSGSGDANDVLLMLWTWQHGDITLSYPEDSGDLAKTLGRIKARCLIMPSSTDQFFSSVDSEEEVKNLKHAEFRCIESVNGHLAAGGYGTKEDTSYQITEIGQFLSSHAS
ncbi:homoserine acetyltransferase [Coleophoma cylindrospora]|uniref:Homoserine acetyltransferase n=1 Tax=Coleophoma cylindrospora TaxID=1849047 RepID=A0A3D8R0J8_9HELO|nr:homoserine acetyltransferase [Coleophoma cylindrospora]